MRRWRGGRLDGHFSRLPLQRRIRLPGRRLRGVLPVLPAKVQLGRGEQRIPLVERKRNATMGGETRDVLRPGGVGRRGLMFMRLRPRVISSTPPLPPLPFAWLSQMKLWDSKNNIMVLPQASRFHISWPLVGTVNGTNNEGVRAGPSSPMAEGPPFRLPELGKKEK